MLKLKTVSLLKHRSDLSILPEGKLLINTINAHSYNTALKDAGFAEALLKGGALIPDGASMVLAFRWLRKESIERTAGWDLFEYEMERLNRKGGICYFLWDKHYNGNCTFTNISNGETQTSEKKLNQFPMISSY